MKPNIVKGKIQKIIFHISPNCNRCKDASECIRMTSLRKSIAYVKKQLKNTPDIKVISIHHKKYNLVIGKPLDKKPLIIITHWVEVKFDNRTTIIYMNPDHFEVVPDIGIETDVSHYIR